MDSDEIARRAELLQEKCGIFACLANGSYPTSLDVAHIICIGLIGLQHRGQEAAGIVTSTTSEAEFVAHRGIGLLSQIFHEAAIKNLKGNLGLGHTRYSTSGGIDLQLAQPFVVHTSYGTLSVAHNGELVNSKKLRKKVLESGVGLSTGSDSELITQCLSLPPPNEFRIKSAEIIQRNKFNNSNENNELKNGFASSSSENAPPRKTSQHNLSGDPDEEILSRLLHLMSLTPLSYSLILMYQGNLFAIRDPFGNRPLTCGMLIPPPEEGGPGASSDNLTIEGWVVSSESCSFPSVCAKIYRDLEPGEILKISKNELPKTLTIVERPNGSPLPAFCIFEYVYFARPDSFLEGQMVYNVRTKCGKQLAIEAPIHPSPEMVSKVIVSPIPETSIPAALGFAEQANYPYVEVFARNRYVGRTFIQPSTRLRRLGVAKKFGPLTQNFEGKIVILIEDSIVRGTTVGALIKVLKEAGAAEVHIRIASPPLHYPCYMGINIPTKEELIANHLNEKQLAQSLGANSLIYLSLDGLKSSVQSGILEKQEKTNKPKPTGHCVACLNGEYPVDLQF